MKWGPLAVRGTGLGVAFALMAFGIGGAHAQDDPAYPAATCAALWMAHARTPLGPGSDPMAFRDEAVRRTDDAEAVDAFIATQTLRLTDLIYAYLDLADDNSRASFESLMRTCQRFASSTPEIAAPSPPRPASEVAEKEPIKPSG